MAEVELELYKKGAIEDEFAENVDPLLDFAARPPASQRYPVLASIPPYGETIVDGEKAERLADELAELAQDPAAEKISALASAVRELILRAAEDAEFAARFIGE